MAMDQTITEQDMDAAARALVQGFGCEPGDTEPDLAVDGLSESIVARLFSFLTSRRP